MHELLEQYALEDPIDFLRRWWKTAEQQGLTLPEGIALSTVGPNGRPSSRMVLLKSLQPEGLVFYTNYNSRKAHELEANPYASLLMWWPELERQVRAEGKIERVPSAQSDAYFMSRPRGSRISAWASPQSEIVADKPTLQAMSDAVEARFEGKEVTRPDFWGGYLLRPDRMEFWQGRARRLHDRLVYLRAENSWKLKRLAP